MGQLLPQSHLTFNMKYLVIFTLIIGVSQASVIGGLLVPSIPVGAVIKGPSARGVSVGSDGAVATAVEGATILAGGKAGLSAVVSPGIVAAASVPAVVAAAPAIVAASPVVVSHGTGALIAGPSGTIATNNGVGLGVAPVVAAPAVAVGPSIAIAKAAVAPGLLGVGHW